MWFWTEKLSSASPEYPLPLICKLFQNSFQLIVNHNNDIASEITTVFTMHENILLNIY